MRVLIVGLLLCGNAFGQTEHWVAAWGTSQQLYRSGVPPTPRPPSPPNPARRFESRAFGEPQQSDREDDRAHQHWW